MMRVKSLAWVLGLVVALSLVTRAEEPAETPAKQDKSQAKALKLTKPWSDLTSLSEEQKQKIYDIHKQANAEVKAIRDKEEADIMALLSDEQKAELQRIAEQQKAEQKARRAAAKEKAKETEDKD